MKKKEAKNRKKCKKDNAALLKIKSSVTKILGKPIEKKEPKYKFKKLFSGKKNALEKPKDVEKPSYMKKREEEQKQKLEEDTIIRFDKVSKSFCECNILDDVYFEVEKGDIFGIIGLSGSGKTTLLNLLIGFLEPDEGDVLIKTGQDGIFRSIFGNRKAIEKHFGFSSQESSFYPDLTPEENLVHFAMLYNLSRKKAEEAAKELLEAVGLTVPKGVLSGQLSAGMQKKLDIACSLVNEPKILVLDEPTANLDTLARKDILRIIGEVNKKGTTIILASHLLQDVENVCTKVGVLHKKKIVKVLMCQDFKKFSARAEKIYLEYQSGDYEKTREALTRKKLPIQNIEERDNKLIVTTSDMEKMMPEMLKIIEIEGQKIESIKVEEPDLNEIFEKIVTERT